MKIISGGQSGIDRLALDIAHELGIETGGFAPRGYRTEDGPRPELGTKFGLLETSSHDYPPRTSLNVKHSDGTAWFGTGDSTGYECTLRAAKKHSKPWIENPSGDELEIWMQRNGILTLNVAGNRGSHCPPTALVLAAGSLRFVLETRLVLDNEAKQERLL